MSIIYKYRAYNYDLKEFTEQVEFTSPEPLLALVQLRFNALADVDRENAAPDFKLLTEAINNSFTWSDSKKRNAVEKQSKKQFAVYPFKFRSQHHIYFVDVLVHPALKVVSLS